MFIFLASVYFTQQVMQSSVVLFELLGMKPFSLVITKTNFLVLCNVKMLKASTALTSGSLFVFFVVHNGKEKTVK